MFKVGQRVHNNVDGYYCKILDIKETTNWAWVEKDNYDLINVNVNDLHETAQTMFEALGFETDDNGFYICKDAHSLYFNFHISWIKSSGIYTVKEWRSGGFRITNITIELHKALHQMCIELGWLDD